MDEEGHESDDWRRVIEEWEKEGFEREQASK